MVTGIHPRIVPQATQSTMYKSIGRDPYDLLRLIRHPREQFLHSARIPTARLRPQLTAIQTRVFTYNMRTIHTEKRKGGGKYREEEPAYS
jgi:hypothetical protein